MTARLALIALLGFGVSCSSGELDLITTRNGEPCLVCGSACVDVLTDPDHCGTCDKKCKKEEACCDGECQNVATDPNHCGSCGAVCGAAQSCRMKQCSCTPPAVVCGDECLMPPSMCAPP